MNEDILKLIEKSAVNELINILIVKIVIDKYFLDEIALYGKHVVNEHTLLMDDVISLEKDVKLKI